MAYPVQLFDFVSKEGKEKSGEFLSSLNQELKSVFGNIPTKDHMKYVHRWSAEDLPDFLQTVGTEATLKILKKVPEGELRWRGSVGIYGRKNGSVIKRTDDILYRVIIHLGTIEAYYLDGEGFPHEPVVLPNGYALLCSPVMVGDIDIKVNRGPIQKNLEPQVAQYVSKIRPRNYLRSTIVLDLLSEGLNVPDLKAASVPKEDEPTESETKEDEPTESETKEEPTESETKEDEQ